jgi:hypothetical protein
MLALRHNAMRLCGFTATADGYAGLGGTMERPKGIMIPADKQRRVEVYKDFKGGYQVQLYNSDPIAMKTIDDYRNSLVDVHDGSRRTMMNMTEQTLDALVEAYIFAKHHGA